MSFTNRTLDFTNAYVLNEIIQLAKSEFQEGSLEHIKLEFATIVNHLGNTGDIKSSDSKSIEQINLMLKYPLFNKTLHLLLLKPIIRSMIYKYHLKSEKEQEKIRGEILEQIHHILQDNSTISLFDNVISSDNAKFFMHCLTVQAESHLLSFPHYANRETDQKVWRSSTSLLQFIDRDFMHYNANHFNGTNITISSGPHTKEEVAHLITDTVFNTKYKISKIICFGDKIDDIDFINYFLYPKGTIIQYGKYSVTVLNIEGEWEGMLKHYPDDKILPIESKDSRFVKSKLQIEDDKGNIKILTVNFFKLRDNQTLHVIGKAERELHKLWLHRDQLLIHCASGAGRSGSLVFAYILSRQLYKIMVGDEKNAAKNIIKLLTDLRKNRPALVNTKEQFEQAIRFAVTLAVYNKVLLPKSCILFGTDSSTKKRKSNHDRNHLSMKSSL